MVIGAARVLTCMCMYVMTNPMRTTIEISNEQRAKLLDLAARRGLKGFSTLVQEALDAYLRRLETREAEVQAALALRGSLSATEAAVLEETSRSLREKWR